MATQILWFATRGSGIVSLILFSAVAINLIRLTAYWNGNPLERTRTSHLARIAQAT